jgi:hypothetical protein
MNNWLEKYKPKNLKDLYLFENYIKKMEDWFYKIDKTNKIVLNIQGPIGSGKTILANLYLKSKNYNINYFCINNIKNKNCFIEKLKENSKTYDILNLLKFKKQKNCYIIDEDDNNNLSKNDLNEIIKHLLISKNPIIIVGNYNKAVHYPKKYLVELKINKPNDILLEKILNNILSIEKIKLDIFEKKKIIKKSQYDIRKLIIISEYLLTENFNENLNNINNTISSKDIDYNLYNSYNQLMNNYISTKNTISHNENLLNSLVYNNIFNEFFYNTNTNKKDLADILYNLSKKINQVQNFEKYYYEYQYDFIEYISLYQCNMISYTFNNLNKKLYKKFTNIEYPRNIYINNQNNLYKKIKYNFEDIDNYCYINNNNINNFLLSYIINNKDNYKIENIKFIIKYLNIDNDIKINFLENI